MKEFSSKEKAIGFGVSAGVVVGAVVGQLTGEVGLWMSICIVIGAGISATIDKKYFSKKDDDGKG